MGSSISTFNLGQGQWNSQGSSWGNSGNVPVQQLTDSQASTPPQAPVPFWDAELTQGLDPANGNLSPWDVVTIGGWTLPGKSVVDARRGRRIDVKQVKGKHYATLTFNGYDPAKVSIVTTIWTQPQLDLMAVILPILESPPAKFKDGSFQAFDIKHPALQLRQITQVLIEEIGCLRQSGVKGAWELRIQALEYRRVATQATATVTGSDLKVKTAISASGPLVTPGNDANFLGPL